MQTKLSYLSFFILFAFAATIAAAIEPTSVPLIRPSGIVCPAVVCPSPGESTPASTCPNRCNNSCVQVPDPCCPGLTVAMCSDEYSSALGVTTTPEPSFSNGPSASASSTTDSPVTSTAQSSSPSATLLPSESPSQSSPGDLGKPEGSGVTLSVPDTMLPLLVLVLAMLMG